MEFLDKLILPQSANHIKLLHYIAILLLTISIPYLSLIFSGTILSLSFFRRYFINNNNLYLRFAKDCMKIVSFNYSSAFALGLLPLFTLILVYTQMLHKSNIYITSDLFLSFLFITAGLIFIYIFRLTFSLNLILKNVEQNTIPDYSIEDFNRLKFNSNKMLPRYGYFGIVFLLAGIWILIASLTTLTNFGQIEFDSFISTLLNLKTFTHLIIFILFSFALTASFLLFYVFFWQRENYKFEEDYKELFIKTNSRIVNSSALLIPVFVLLDIFLLPKVLLSGSTFAYITFLLIFLLIALSLNYYIANKNEINYSPISFFLIFLAIFTYIIQKEIIIKNATETHALLLVKEYNELLASLKATKVKPVINAAEIYQVKCTACHQFDKKLVGPPFNEVLPKYEGNLNKLISFIQNPVKINPAYPPMPNQGLKPDETEAISKYLLEEFSKIKKQ